MISKSKKPGVRNYSLCEVVRNYSLCEVTAILVDVCIHLFVCFMIETTELNFMEFSFMNVWNQVVDCHGQL
jgi:hypothetical protein